MFIKLRKHFCRVLLPISFAINPLFLFMFSEKVNAQIITLNCNVKSHSKNSNSEVWNNSNFQYDFDINQSTKKIVLFRKVGESRHGFNFTIMNQIENKIIAISDRRFTNQGAIFLTALTLDLNSKTITGANTISRETGGISFDNFYGKCFQN